MSDGSRRGGSTGSGSGVGIGVGSGAGGGVKDFIGYGRLLDGGMRQVVRWALESVARHGLQGLHHFYIRFQTRHEGVEISRDLALVHPDEMVIVLEHSFEDLEVGEDYFRVKLFFSGVEEVVKVPFAALLDFQDRGVNFALRFMPGGSGGSGEEEAGGGHDNVINLKDYVGHEKGARGGKGSDKDGGKDGSG